MALFEIKSRFNDKVLFSLECGSLRLCLEAAVNSGADLRGAYLRGAVLRGADLRDADLRGADLTGALFLTRPQLASTRTDSATRLP
jgi:uncharacterized protein YjbI with pentapeptide repeats